jgi:hypothetical protein
VTPAVATAAPGRISMIIVRRLMIAIFRLPFRMLSCARLQTPGSGRRPTGIIGCSRPWSRYRGLRRSNLVRHAAQSGPSSGVPRVFSDQSRADKTLTLRDPGCSEESTS